MLAHVISQNIQWPVIAVCLLLKAVPKVMLSNEMPCAWVKTASEEAAHDQIDQRPDPVCRHEEVVEDDLNKYVHEMPLGEALSAHERGSKCVEENLEGTGRWRSREFVRGKIHERR